LGDVYIPLPINNKKEVNLNKEKVSNIVGKIAKSKDRKISVIINKHLGSEESKKLVNVVNAAEECHESAINGLDIIEYLGRKMNENIRSKLLLIFEKIKKEYRNEVLLMTTLLYNGLVRSNMDIDNIGFM
jgi:hypothetical protein